MANTRATKSGINLAMQKKLEATYSQEDEDKARKWIEDILSEKIEGTFFDGLKDGIVLCRLLNTLQSNLVPDKYLKASSMAFKQMESVNAFLDGCKKYGMDEKDLFVTLDLYEKQNKNMVIATLFSLGRKAQKNGYEGPVLGPKEAEANPREFSEDQIREGRSVIGLQMGTNQVANQAGMTPYGQGRQIADTRTIS